MSVYDELITATEVTRKKGESDQAHLGRLLAAADAIDDVVFEKLSKAAQKWINTAVDAQAAKSKLPVPKGMEVEAEATEADEKPEKKAKGKAKPEKKAKGKKKGNGIGGKRARLFTDDQVITVVAKENPKREGSNSYDRFELYAKGKKGMTVQQALAAGVRSGDLKYDQDHGYIKIS